MTEKDIMLKYGKLINGFGREKAKEIVSFLLEAEEVPLIQKDGRVRIKDGTAVD